MLNVPISLKHKVSHRLPALLAMPFRLMPFRIQRIILNQLLDTIFGEALAAGDMNFLISSRIKFEIEDCRVNWTCSVNKNKLQIINSTVSDATIRCHLSELVLLANQKVDPDTLFFQRRLVIEGDTELGLTMKNIMDTLDPEKLPAPLIKLLKILEQLLLSSNNLDYSTI